jgi:hypothetical protein
MPSCPGRAWPSPYGGGLDLGAGGGELGQGAVPESQQGEWRENDGDFSLTGRQSAPTMGGQVRGRPAPRSDTKATPMRTEDHSEDRPWEQPGALRRDSDPHRGNWLLAAATAAQVCGGLSLALMIATLYLLPRAGEPPPRMGRITGAAAQALPLGSAVLALGGAVLGACVLGETRRDLDRMWQARMDPRGQEATKAARRRATSALALISCLLLLIASGVLLALVR